MKQTPFTALQFIRTVLAVWLAMVLALSTGAQTIGNHPAVCDQRDVLKPWMTAFPEWAK
jgi:hypothetical protein